MRLFVFVKDGEVINVPPLQLEDAHRGMAENKRDVLREHENDGLVVNVR